MIKTSRRGFLTGLSAVLITAPAICRATSLMPVKVMPPELFLWSQNGWELSARAPISPEMRALLALRIADAEETLARVFLPRVYAEVYKSSDVAEMVLFGAGA